MDKDLTKEIYKHIKSEILDGNYQGNDKISERHISEIFNTSRTTVRNAINLLEKDGWIYVKPKSGTYVAEVDLEIVKEAYIIRSILEPELLILAYPNIDQDDINQMRANCIKMQTSNQNEYINSEYDNHRIIRKKCENKLMTKIFKELLHDYRRISFRASSQENRKERSIIEWTKIIDAIESKQIYLAKQYLQQHIANSSEAFWNEINHK